MRAARVLLACLFITAPAVADGQAGRAAYAEGRRLMAADEPGKAEKQFERAIAAEPNVAEYHLWLGNAVGEQIGDASVLRQPFMARRIKASYERAVALDPTLIDAREGLVGFHLEAPAVVGGSVDKAKEQAVEIARLDPIRGHLVDARIAWQGKDTAGTERAWRAVIAARPDSVGPVLNLAIRMQEWRRPAESFALLDEFLARHPTSAPARFQFGRLTAISGEQLPRGERCLRGLLADEDWEAGPWVASRGAVYARLGDVLRKQGRTAEARTAYQTALSLDKDSQVAKDGLAALR